MVAALISSVWSHTQSHQMNESLSAPRIMPATASSPPATWSMVSIPR